jgi:hypothetical protein
VGSVREEISRQRHGGPKRARSWKRRTQPRNTYSLSGLLYSERGDFSPTAPLRHRELYGLSLTCLRFRHGMLSHDWPNHLALPIVQKEGRWRHGCVLQGRGYPPESARRHRFLKRAAISQPRHQAAERRLTSASERSRTITKNGS